MGSIKADCGPSCPSLRDITVMRRRPHHLKSSHDITFHCSNNSHVRNGGLLKKCSTHDLIALMLVQFSLMCVLIFVSLCIDCLPGGFNEEHKHHSSAFSVHETRSLSQFHKVSKSGIIYLNLFDEVRA